MKIALLFGSSGLIGEQLINHLIQNNDYNKIKIFVRSEPKIKDSKIEIIKTDFNNLKNHVEDIKGDDCFFALEQQNKIHLIKTSIKELSEICL